MKNQNKSDTKEKDCNTNNSEKGSNCVTKQEHPKYVTLGDHKKVLRSLLADIKKRKIDVKKRYYKEKNKVIKPYWSGSEDAFKELENKIQEVLGDDK